MKRLHNEYEIDEDPRRLDFARLHEWLTKSYWSPGTTRERVEQAARGSSMVVGAYTPDKQQIGYLRVVSDRTTFAWIADVYVDEPHRGKGIAKALLRFALEHPQYQGLRKWALATRDAHELYKTMGFRSLPAPERWMMYRPPDAPDAPERADKPAL